MQQPTVGRFIDSAVQNKQRGWFSSSVKCFFTTTHDHIVPHERQLAESDKIIGLTLKVLGHNFSVQAGGVGVRTDINKFFYRTTYNDMYIILHRPSIKLFIKRQRILL